jgi:hypothetical protein
MHTVTETHAFHRQAEQAGMTEDEIEALILYLSATPTAGVVIKGTGGCRKVRMRGRGRGKSGGYRTITFYSGPDVPVYLIAVFSKGERDNLTQGERNILAKVAKAITAECGKKIVKARARA